MEKNLRIGEVLKEYGYITDEQIEQVLAYQKQTQTKKRVGELLIELGYITEDQKLEALAKRLHYELINLDTYPVNGEAVKKVPRMMADKYILIPVGFHDNALVVAMNDPLDFYAIEDMTKTADMQINVVLAREESIRTAIDYYYSEIEAQLAVMDINENAEEDVNLFADELDDGDAQAPVVRLLNSLLIKGYNSTVSDIHIEPFEKETIIRMRNDGMLTPYLTVTPTIHQALVARTKILAQMDIAEKRIPQDGHFKVTLEGVELNIRVSVIPTVYGEKIVMRYLNSNTAMDMEESFGMTKENYDAFMRIMKNPNGIIYITGPTGSGKTTTLYMALEEFAKQPVNISTIEDPVERNLPHINQMQVNPLAGLTFETGLRALLRQDPDIIMIGETRDNETANISVRAAITGHVVLSTLHTNDSISTIVRLRDMGVQNYLIAGSVVGVVAQRLAKKICPHCMETYYPSAEELVELGAENVTTLKRGRGCHLCNGTGYKGRIGVHEVFEIDSVVRKMISDAKPIESIYQYMEDVKQMPTLRSVMREYVVNGITTFDEYVKLTYNI